MQSGTKTLTDTQNPNTPALHPLPKKQATKATSVLECQGFV
jgi:hypothetical protein